MLPETREAWKACSSYAQCHMMFLSIDCVSKNDDTCTISQQDFAMSKKIKFYNFFNKYPLGAAVLVVVVMITPLLPWDGGTARTAIKVHAVNLIENRGKMAAHFEPVMSDW